MEAAKLDVLEIASSKRSMQKDALVTSFLEHSKTILNGLQFLSELHPAISGNGAVLYPGAAIDKPLQWWSEHLVR